MSESKPDLADRRALTKQTLGITAGIPLQASSGGIDELRKDIQRLMDIEAIKQTKHTYFRCIDTANMEELAEITHKDISVHYKGGTYEWKFQGRDDFIASVSQSFHSEAIGHHNGHMPEIQMLSETEATGIWYLHDNMWILNHGFHTTGTALYWDRYLKVNGRWVIKETSYERLYEINRQSDGREGLSSHYLAGHGAKLEA